MSRIVILSCTNRPQSNTWRVSLLYERMLRERGVECEVLDFRQLPRDIAFAESFGNRSGPYRDLIDRYVSAFRKFIFVVPEYNGSFPGILKTFIDSVHPREWADKDACIVGVSDGRAGNLRGMEHLTGILNYLKMHVYHDKLPISAINKVMSADGEFTDEGQRRACETQLDGFLVF